MTDDKSFLVKDTKKKIRKITNNLFYEIEKQLSRITGVEMTFLDGENFDDKLLFGGLFKEKHEQSNEYKGILSAINIYDDIIPVGLMKKRKAVIAVISGEDFLRLFFNMFNLIFEIKEA